jgi:hypothetical protein
MRVRAKSCYILQPVPIDWEYTAYANTVVRVINLPMAPKCNTMGQCHIETLDKVFIGMVSTNSLLPLDIRNISPRKKKNAITT